MGNVFYFEWEVQMMAWLQEKMGEGLASVVSFFSAFGEEIVLILLVGFLYWCYDKKLGRKVGLNILMGLVWSPMVKNIALRIRPYIANREKIRLLRLVDSEGRERRLQEQRRHEQDADCLFHLPFSCAASARLRIIPLPASPGRRRR